MIQKIIEPVFTVLYISLLAIMCNFIGQYSYKSGKTSSLQRTFSIAYTVFVGIYLFTRTYSLFLNDTEKADTVIGAGLLAVAVMAPVVMFLFYIEAIRSLSLRRTPGSSVLIFALLLILLILGFLPQNSWFESSRSLLMQIIRSIVTLIVLTLISMTLISNSIKRKNVKLQRAAGIFFLGGFFYSFGGIIQNTRISKILYLLALLLILILIYTWYKNLREITKMERV